MGEDVANEVIVQKSEDDIREVIIENTAEHAIWHALWVGKQE